MIISFKTIKRFASIAAFLVSTQACAQQGLTAYLSETGLPEVALKSKEATKTINLHLKSYFQDFSCDDGTLPSITLESIFKGERYVSLSYSLAGYCTGNAHPFEYSGGFTYEIATGNLIKLNELASEQDIQSVIKERYSQIKKKECLEPEHFGEFYLSEKGIVLKEFYSTKLEIACEFEVAIESGSSSEY